MTAPEELAERLRTVYIEELSRARREPVPQSLHATQVRAMLHQAYDGYPMLYTEPDERTWIWSDLHLGHDFSIGAFNRPFRSAQAADKAMHRAWIVRAADGDTTVCLGDVSVDGCLQPHHVMRWRQAPGSKVLVLGNHDLLNLDTAAVRRHLGVVLQDGQVAADTILNNVAGSSRLSTDEIWDAVRAAGLEDDVRAMPMGLHTMLHEGGGGLSREQRQRLLIARALARKPRILLLDEATSAVDNRTQSVVQDSLGKLSITRIVIAHRLSTVRDVDRIYVLDRGRIAESGGYDELIARDGVLAELAKRQLV